MAILVSMLLMTNVMSQIYAQQGQIPQIVAELMRRI